MVIGTLKEIKDHERRVGLTPDGVRALVRRGHQVIVQRRCGIGSGFEDEQYLAAGAKIKDSPAKIVKNIDILVKVKEPLSEEYYLLDFFQGKTLFTFLHLSGVDPMLTKKLVLDRITGIAYETVTDSNGKLPLLTPMSEVAGVLAVQYGAQYLQKKYRGRGLTLGRITNTDSAQVVVLGGGVVGSTSARTAAGMGAKVTILDIRPAVLEKLKKEFRRFFGPSLFKNLTFVVSTPQMVSHWVKKADVLIGAVLVPGTRAPIVASEAMVRSMQKGAVIVDVSIDQGGCIWGSRPTSHTYPTYDLDGKIYCCVTNMPGQVAHQSTQALTSATLSFMIDMADRGVVSAIARSLKGNKGLANGVNTFAGHITYKPVADDLGMQDMYASLPLLLSTKAIDRTPRRLTMKNIATSPARVPVIQ